MLFYFTERTIIVSEYSGKPLNQCTRQINSDKNVIIKVFYQIASGLAYLNKNGIVCHNVEPENILFDPIDNSIKLFNYGLWYMTNGGEYVTFPIGLEHFNFKCYSSYFVNSFLMLQKCKVYAPRTFTWCKK